MIFKFLRKFWSAILLAIVTALAVSVPARVGAVALVSNADAKASFDAVFHAAIGGALEAAFNVSFAGHSASEGLDLLGTTGLPQGTVPGPLAFGGTAVLADPSDPLYMFLHAFFPDPVVTIFGDGKSGFVMSADLEHAPIALEILGSGQFGQSPVIPIDPSRPVPEPETYALILVGLLAVGAWHRLRI